MCAYSEGPGRRYGGRPEGASYGSEQGGAYGSALGAYAQRLGELFPGRELSDEAIRFLLDFYQQQIAYYTERAEGVGEGRGVWDLLFGVEVELEPRDLAWEDLRRVTYIYTQLAQTRAGYAEPEGADRQS